MSTQAPWIAVAVDWQDSEMFEGASPEERLAWICLLCHAKTNGRAGVVLLKEGAFCRMWQISKTAALSMLERAERHGAITIGPDGVITVVNWKRYQDPKHRSVGAQAPAAKGVTNKRRRISKTPKKPENDATSHTSPPTTHHSPPTPPGGRGEAEPLGPAWMSSPDFLDAWERWKKHRQEIRHPLKPTTIKAQLKELEKWGHDRAIAAINHTIFKGWQGLVEPTAGPGQRGRASSARAEKPNAEARGEYAEPDRPLPAL